MYWLLLGILAIFSLQGCGSPETGNNGLTDGLSLTPDNEIAGSTIIDLDFSRFPSLPENQIPADDVIHVSTSGNDVTGDGSEGSPYRTIARAFTQASSGYTLVISGGTYAEQFEPGDYRALVVEKNNITLMARPDDTVTLVPASGNVHYGVNVLADDFTIRGIHIKDFEVGILFGDSILEGMVIADCAISGASEGIATWDGTVNDLLAFNVSITDATLIGFHCGNGTGNNWRLENCSISMDGTGGGSYADAFAIENGDNILLVNCRVSGASADGIDAKATRVVVYACTVHHIGRNGIKLWHGGDVINSLVHHTGADAAIVVEEGDVRLLHTIMAYHNFQGETSYNMTFGYDSRDSMDISLINCIFFNTSGGAWISPNARLSISHCLFFGMENGRVLDYGDLSVMISQGAAGLSALGTGNLVTDPLLDSDFHALGSSPIINAGIQLEENYPPKDRNGNPRVTNGSPDLGCFEDF